MSCPCEKNKCAGSNPGNVLELAKQCDPVLFHKVLRPASLGDDTETPADTLDYRNVLLTYEANNHSYLYSSDGVPTFISLGDVDTAELEAKIAGLAEELATETTNRETADTQLESTVSKVSGDLAAEAMDRKQADTELGNQITTLQNNLGQAVSELQADVANEVLKRSEADQNLQNQISDLNESVETQLDSLDASITALEDATVQKDTTISADASTITLTKTTGELTADGTETGLPLPVASAESAGVMNASTYNAVQENSENIDSILNGAVVIEDLPAAPTQAELTTQWEAETGKDTLINRASIYDKTNGKIWYYYTNSGAWEPADIQNPEINISQATNEALGIVKGSTENGQIAIEADGSMSLNGYDAINSNIENLQSEMPKVPAAMVYDFVSPAGDNNPSTADNANIMARVVETATGNVTNATLMMPMASNTQAGSITAADKAKLDSMLEIISLNDSLELDENGQLSVVGGGQDINVLSNYTATVGDNDVYGAAYVNSRLDVGSTLILGSQTNSNSYSVGIGRNASAYQGSTIAIGNLSKVTSPRGIAIGLQAEASNGVALGAYSDSTRSNEVSIGTTKSNIANISTRFLANVKAGTLPTDAVNLQQMQDAIAAAVGDIDTALETLISGTGAN